MMSVIMPSQAIEIFKKASKANTHNGIETGGWLYGRSESDESAVVTHVVINPQKGSGFDFEELKSGKVFHPN